MEDFFIDISIPNNDTICTIALQDFTLYKGVSDSCNENGCDLTYYKSPTSSECIMTCP